MCVSDTEGKGCIMAVEVLYERKDTGRCVTTCPALKWVLSRGVTTEGNSQDTIEKSRWEGGSSLSWPFMCFVKSQISAVWSNKCYWKHHKYSCNCEGAAVTAGSQTLLTQPSKHGADMNKLQPKLEYSSLPHRKVFLIIVLIDICFVFFSAKLFTQSWVPTKANAATEPNYML